MCSCLFLYVRDDGEGNLKYRRCMLFVEALGFDVRLLVLAILSAH